MADVKEQVPGTPDDTQTHIFGIEYKDRLPRLGLSLVPSRGP